MRAVRWHGRRDVRVEEVPDAPVPGPGEIRIAVEWCGICGTDVEEYAEGPVVIPTEPHPLTGAVAPLIVGHEVVGRITEAGTGVAHLRPGQLVALDGYLTCGRCRACRHHQPNLCVSWAQVGMSWPGGLAEALTVPAELAVPATGPVGAEDVAADELALAEPFSVAVRALRRGRLAIGERVAVLGGGTIGQAVAQVARAAGAGPVTVAEPVAHRRALAGRFGAGTAGAAEELAGLDADLVVDCTGHPLGPALALPAVRKGGRAVLLGVNLAPVALDQLSVVLREIELIGSVGHVRDEDFTAAVDLICTRRVAPGPLISHRVPLSGAVSDGIGFLAGEGRATAMKILVSPRL